MFGFGLAELLHFGGQGLDLSPVEQPQTAEGPRGGVVKEIGEDPRTQGAEALCLRDRYCPSCLVYQV